MTNAEIAKEVQDLIKICHSLKADVAVLTTAMEAQKEISDLRHEAILEKIDTFKRRSPKDIIKSIFKGIARFWYVYVVFGLYWFTSEKRGVEGSAYDAVKKTTQVFD